MSTHTARPRDSRAPGSHPGPHGASARRAIRLRALAVVSAVVAALAVWVVAVPVLGVPLRAVTAPEAAGQVVGAGAVATAAAVASLAGWGLLTLLERTTRRARTAWTAVAAAVAVVSLAGPLTAGATPAATVVLVLLHLVVAGVLVSALRRTTGR